MSLPAPECLLPKQLARRHFVQQDERPSHLDEVDLIDVDPSLRALLFTDGTVTRALEAQTLSPVTVEVISQERVVITGATARHLAIPSGFGAVRRRVTIGIGSRDIPVICAESHILPSRLPDEFLHVLDDVPDGIGASLQQVQLESWREMLWFGFDPAPGWHEPARRGTAITRLYRVIAGGEPALLISETFTVECRNGKYRLDSGDVHTEPNSSSIS